MTEVLFGLYGLEKAFGKRLLCTSYFQGYTHIRQEYGSRIKGTSCKQTKILLPLKRTDNISCLQNRKWYLPFVLYLGLQIIQLDSSYLNMLSPPLKFGAFYQIDNLIKRVNIYKRNQISVVSISQYMYLHNRARRNRFTRRKLCHIMSKMITFKLTVQLQSFYAA